MSYKIGDILLGPIEEESVSIEVGGQYFGMNRSRVPQGRWLIMKIWSDGPSRDGYQSTFIDLMELYDDDSLVNQLGISVQIEGGGCYGLTYSKKNIVGHINLSDPQVAEIENFRKMKQKELDILHKERVTREARKLGIIQ